MTIESLLEQLEFSVKAIEKKTDKMPEVKALVTVAGRRGKTLLHIKEIGFDESSATIYLEIE